MKKYLLLSLFSFVFILCVDAQQIITDRPDQTESSISLPANNFQIETGTLFENDDEASVWTLNTSLFRYGIGRGFELRLVTELARLNYADEKQTGLNDLQFGLKYQFVDKQLKVAYLFHLIVPSGNEGQTAGTTGFSNRLLLSHDVTDRLGIGYNVGFDYYDSEQYGFNYSWAAGYSLTEKVGFYGEFFGDVPQFEEVVVRFDCGFTYLLHDRVQADISFGTGLTDTYNYYSLGLSWWIPE